ncbi:MAG: HepT-like ribonuclease domain-containing protein [Acidimicrobiia bacterium]
MSLLRRAVERCLEIVGEASKAISDSLTAAHPEIPWSDMAKVRP